LQDVGGVTVPSSQPVPNSNNTLQLPDSNKK
jgi:hypothetical protein